MTESSEMIVLKDCWGTPARPGRRPGFTERSLVGPAQSSQQNLVLVEAEPGAEVETHSVANSETMFFIEGDFEVTVPGNDSPTPLNAGDMVYFSPGMSHGMRCVSGPGRYLIVFAPASTKAGKSAG